MRGCAEGEQRGPHDTSKGPRGCRGRLGGLAGAGGSHRALSRCGGPSGRGVTVTKRRCLFYSPNRAAPTGLRQRRARVTAGPGDARRGGASVGRGPGWAWPAAAPPSDTSCHCDVAPALPNQRPPPAAPRGRGASPLAGGGEAARVLSPARRPAPPGRCGGTACSGAAAPLRARSAMAPGVTAIPAGRS